MPKQCLYTCALYSVSAFTFLFLRRSRTDVDRMRPLLIVVVLDDKTYTRLHMASKTRKHLIGLQASQEEGNGRKEA